MSSPKRSAFFVSDGTGITAEALGKSLLSQFETIDFKKVTLPYIDSEEKARKAVEEINLAAEQDGVQPLIFDTIVNKQISQQLANSKGYTVDIFSTFLSPLEKVLDTHSSYSVGKSHYDPDDDAYKNRINAVNYALDNDDGASVVNYSKADVILIGVSRSGKTPTSLYLALQFGIFAANYPITEEDMEESKMPVALRPFQDKLFGLTINPERLSAIRNERRANSRYSSIIQCEDEVRTVEGMFRRSGTHFVDTTHFSIEEISTKILLETGLERR